MGNPISLICRLGDIFYMADLFVSVFVCHKNIFANILVRVGCAFKDMSKVCIESFKG